MDTDQDSQFGGQSVTQLLKDNDIQVSMDGKDAWRDNTFVEQLWCSIKYEEVYLHGYDYVQDAKAGLKRYLEFCSHKRSN